LPGWKKGAGDPLADPPPGNVIGDTRQVLQVPGDGRRPGYRWSMPYTATVLRMMIASPSDTIEARNAVESAAYG